MEKKLIKIFETVGVISVIILTLTVLVQVVFREVFRIATTWSVEVSRAMFTALVFFGAAIDIAEENHLGVEMVKDAIRKNKTVLLVFEIIGDIVTYLFLFTLGLGCFKKTISEWSTVIPTVEWMNYGEIYLIMLIGTLGMLYFQVRRTMRYVSKYKKGEYYTTLSIKEEDK